MEGHKVRMCNKERGGGLKAAEEGDATSFDIGGQLTHLQHTHTHTHLEISGFDNDDGSRCVGTPLLREFHRHLTPPPLSYPPPFFSYYNHFSNVVRGAGFKMDYGGHVSGYCPAPPALIASPPPVDSSPSPFLPSSPLMTPHLIPPSIFLQDSLFHSNVVYVNNGWNCVNIASFKLGHADQVYDNDCVIKNQERVDDLFGEYFSGD